MELDEFTIQIPGFASFSHREKVLHLMWFLHVHANRERVKQTDIRSCYQKRSEQPPNLSLIFSALIERRPRVLLQDAKGYHLEHKIRAAFDEKYGQHQTTIVVSKLLKDLPGRIADEAERLFLKEAITCYHSKAYRAAIIMAWNLTYDHMARWIVADSLRLSSFNSQIAPRLGVTSKRAGIKIVRREDFEKLDEKEMIDIMGNANLLPSGNAKKILEMQLTRRNMAAHPSLITIDAPQADDAISSLVTDIVLALN